MKIKITKIIPIVKELIPEIGSVHEVIKRGETSSGKRVFFIKCKDKTVGVFLEECEVIK